MKERMTPQSMPARLPATKSRACRNAQVTLAVLTLVNKSRRINPRLGRSPSIWFFATLRRRGDQQRPPSLGLGEHAVDRPPDDPRGDRLAPPVATCLHRPPTRDNLAAD